MSDLFWLSQAQFNRIKRYFPYARGMPRIDDFRVVSGIVYVIKNGIQWRDAPPEYGSYKTLYHRFLKWSRRGIFNRIFAELAADGVALDWLTIEATDFNVQRTAARLVKNGMFPAVAVEEDGDFSEGTRSPKHKQYNLVVLEPELQDALKEIAEIEGCSVRGLCDAVYALRKPGYSLSAALRVFIVEYYRFKLKSVLNKRVSKVLERSKGDPSRTDSEPLS